MGGTGVEAGDFGRADRALYRVEPGCALATFAVEAARS